MIGNFVFEDKIFFSMFDVKENETKIYKTELKDMVLKPAMFDMGLVNGKVKIIECKSFPYNISDINIDKIIGKDKGFRKVFKLTIIKLMNQDIQDKIKRKLKVMERDKKVFNYDLYKNWIVDDSKHLKPYYSGKWTITK